MEVAHCDPIGFTTRQGKLIPAATVRVRHIHPAQRLRLGCHPPEQADHWFHFEPERVGIYADTAQKVIPWLQGQAEEFWRTHQPVMAARA